MLKRYTWGLDIARSLTDAGGVGALLQLRDYGLSKDYFPAYDGNGNIAALFDSADGGVAAAYEYSLYGELLRCEGTYAKENSFRFSTKFTDDETGLVYYGRRYYDPRHGRFICRDPKEEFGGRNLYGFVTNNPINRWDYLGMYDGFLACGYSAYGQLAQMTAPMLNSMSVASMQLTTTSANLAASTSTLSNNLRTSLPGLIAAPVAGAVDVVGGLTQTLIGVVTFDGSAVASGLRNAGSGVLSIVGLNEALTQPWIGADQLWTNHGLRMTGDIPLPEGIAIVVGNAQANSPVATNVLALNGMHGWHAGTNATVANQVGPVMLPFQVLAGILHELDPGAVSAEVRYQGVINTVLDSAGDIVANTAGMVFGLLLPRDGGYQVAVVVGNQIPGPGDPNPTGAGGGNTYTGNPTDAWGQYPPFP